jgi:hypothetical protein
MFWCTSTTKTFASTNILTDHTIHTLCFVLKPNRQHVLNQHQSNPVMVQRCLPTSTEWNEMIIAHRGDWKLSLEYEPADPRSDRDEKEGYLAVLVKE